MVRANWPSDTRNADKPGWATIQRLALLALSLAVAMRTAHFPGMDFQSAGTPPQAGTRALVMVVEDDIGQRLDCRELLEDAGFHVIEAGDGKKALQRLSDDSGPAPALIILDLSMPLMDGWDFIATLDSESRLRTIPVVLVSGYEADPGVQDRVSAFLRKPLDPGQLIRIVRALVTS